MFLIIIDPFTCLLTYLAVFFGEVSVRVLCPSLVRLSVLLLLENVFMFSRYKPPIRSMICRLRYIYIFFNADLIVLLSVDDGLDRPWAT